MQFPLVLNFGSKLNRLHPLDDKLNTKINWQSVKTMEACIPNLERTSRKLKNGLKLLYFVFVLDNGTVFVNVINNNEHIIKNNN